MRLNNVLKLGLAAAAPMAFVALALAQTAGQPAPAAAAPAQQPPAVKPNPEEVAKAKQVLIDAAAAIKKMQGVSYKAKKGLENAGFEFGSNGDVWFTRNATTPATSPFMVKGEMVQMGNKFAMESYFNGSRGMWRDETKKEVVEKPITTPDQAAKVKQGKDQLIPPYFFEAEPFIAELNSQQIILGDPVTVGGVDCDVVRIINAANREVRVALAKSDHLPRQMAVITPSKGDKPMTFLLEMTDFKTADVKPAEFHIDLPADFQKRVEEPAKPVMPSNVDPANPAKTPIPPSAVLPKGGLDVGTAAPAWALKQAEGGAPAALADQKGKAVVLGFWGPVFADSRGMLGALEQTRKSADGKSVAFFGVACRANGPAGVESARKMFQEANCNFPLLLDGDASAADYKLRGFPSIAVIDPAGKVAAFFENTPSPEELKAAVDRAVAGDGGAQGK